MRADRLVALLLLIQARGRVTAAEAADQLEVSIATARRDLEALSAAGIPGQRTFRVDRIAEAVVTDLDADHPPGVDLAVAWERVVEEVEQRRSQTWATVLVDTRFAPVLRGQFGRYCKVEGPHDDGRVRVLVAADTPLSIARHLAGWGALVEVVDPAPVRAELARLGAELVERYG